MQHGLGVQGGDALGQCRAAHRVHGMVGVVTAVYLGADDLAAVQVQDQVQVEPAAHHDSRQVGHVPAPDLAGGRDDVGGRRSCGLGRLGAPSAGALPVGFEHAGHAELAAQVHTFVGRHGHDTRRGNRGEARLVGHGQQRSALGWVQGMARGRPHRLRPAIAAVRPCRAFQRCSVRTSIPAISQAGCSRAPVA